MGYNDYLQKHAVANDNISWEFETIPNSVGMIVLILDEDSYTSFVHDVGNSDLSSTVYSPAFVSSIVSENKVNDSGNFLVPHWSIWYVIFVNLNKTCRLKYKIEYDWSDYFPIDDFDDDSYSSIPGYNIIFIFSAIGGIIFIIVTLFSVFKGNFFKTRR